MYVCLPKYRSVNENIQITPLNYFLGRYIYMDRCQIVLKFGVEKIVNIFVNISFE